MATTETIKVIVNAENKTGKGFKDAEKDLDSFGGRLKSLIPSFKQVAVAGAAAGAALIGFGVLSLKKYMEAEKEMTIATTALKNALQNMSEEQMKKLDKEVLRGADAMEGMIQTMNDLGAAAVDLGFDDEEASKAFAKLFLVTKDVTQAQKDLTLAMNLARFSGRSLEESGEAIIKVHGGMTRVLKEFGIEIDANATAVEALTLLEKNLGTAAADAANTMAVKLEILKIRFENFQEAIGKLLAIAITPLFNAIEPIVSKLVQWAEAQDSLGGAIHSIGEAIKGWWGQLDILLEKIGMNDAIVKFWKESVQGLWIMIKEDVKPAFDEWWKSMQPFVPYLQMFAKIMLVTVVAALTAFLILLAEGTRISLEIATVINTITIGALNALGVAIDGVARAFKWAWDQVEGLLNALKRLSGVNIGGAAGRAVRAVLPGFDSGGVVPGPTGSPQLAMVHGGETILPTHKRGGAGSTTVNIYNPLLLDATMIDKLSQEIGRALRTDLRI